MQTEPKPGQTHPSDLMAFLMQDINYEKFPWTMIDGLKDGIPLEPDSIEFTLALKKGDRIYKWTLIRLGLGGPHQKYVALNL